MVLLCMMFQLRARDDRMHTKVLVPKLRMTKWLVLLSFMILILFAVSPVQATVNKVSLPGRDVFLGEQNLQYSLLLLVHPRIILTGLLKMIRQKRQIKRYL